VGRSAQQGQVFGERPLKVAIQRLGPVGECRDADFVVRNPGDDLRPVEVRGQGQWADTQRKIPVGPLGGGGLGSVQGRENKQTGSLRGARTQVHATGQQTQGATQQGRH
jgi:hypothetical protein